MGKRGLVNGGKKGDGGGEKGDGFKCGEKGGRVKGGKMGVGLTVEIGDEGLRVGKGEGYEWEKETA